MFQRLSARSFQSVHGLTEQSNQDCHSPLKYILERVILTQFQEESHADHKCLASPTQMGASIPDATGLSLALRVGIRCTEFSESARPRTRSGCEFRETP